MADFDPNEGAVVKMFPSVAGLSQADIAGFPGGEIASAEAYSRAFEAMSKRMDTDVVKGISVPPTMLSFGKISYMPETYNSGVLQWPGIAPEALRKVVRENVAPQMIIGMRCDDVLRYSQLSAQIWRPGWRIEPIAITDHPSEQDLRDIREAEVFMENCGGEFSRTQARQRDAEHLTDLQRFLDALVRDRMTFGGATVWTDMDHQGKVRAFSLLPCGNIRFTGPQGYENDPKIAFVALDEGGKVIHKFTRDELTFYCFNSRVDPDSFGYPLSEVEMALRMIKGFQNALDLNIDVFDRNATPNGIMVLSGSSVTQRQLDLMNRMWTNLKKGITKAWALPVVGLSDGSTLEVLDLSRMKGNEGYYKDLMNMLMGAFATVYRFPINRLGYRISGHGKDTEPAPDASASLVDDSDPGLAPLLLGIENIINEYILWTRWPHLRFRFNGMNPKEDARSYQLKRDAMTWGEARRAAFLPPLQDVVPDIKVENIKSLKDIASILDLAPLDPNMAGAFQSILTTFLAGDGAKDTEKVGNRMQGKKDPAKTEQHGGTAGVRRDSKNES